MEFFFTGSFGPLVKQVTHVGTNRKLRSVLIWHVWLGASLDCRNAMVLFESSIVSRFSFIFPLTVVPKRGLP